MSVLDFGVDSRFIFRLIKYLHTNPSNKWANSYEFRSNAAGDTTALESLASALVLFEQGLHLPSVGFDHVLVSTWEADSKPYDPDTFLSIPQTVSGTNSAGGTPEPLDMCLSVRRIPSSGRFGHLFYRGALEEGMVEAPAGKAILTSPTAIQTSIDANLATSELEVYIGATVEAPLQMVMISADGSQVRAVTALVQGGVGRVPQDHAWFNRTTTPAPLRKAKV